MGLRHSSTCPYHGQSLLCVKKWFEAQISGILPDVSSYISHFVCLYNFNYTGRPLRGPGIIGIIVKLLLEITSITTLNGQLLIPLPESSR